MKQLFLLAIAAMAAVTTYAQNISTTAGNGTTLYAGDNTPATATGFGGGGASLATDRYGNIYFSGDHRIHKVDRKGIITTIAGNGMSGPRGDGGPATAAHLVDPRAIAIDTAGNIYIADGTEYDIRKIDPNGIITHYAGTGIPGEPGDDGPATAADIQPGCLVTDLAGNLYVASRYRVRKINSAGIISAFAGKPYAMYYSGFGGPATAANLNLPAYQMAFNKAGELYFISGPMLCKVSTAGIITKELDPVTLGDGGDGGPATSAAFNYLFGMCLDGADNMYLSCVNGGRIRRIDAITGIVTTYAGTTEGYSGDGGPATAAQLQHNLSGLIMDCADNLYIPDRYITNRIRKITKIHTPEYISESNTLQVCQNSTANPVSAQLETKSAGTGEPLDWEVTKAPLHGSMAGAPYSTTVGTTTMLPGITYTPAPGYSGPDSFTVVVGPCEQVQDVRTIYVTVNPLPTVAAITGLNAICKGSVVTMSNATAGGVWSIAGTAATISGGTVTGLTPGTATISYTVTDGMCSNAATYTLKVGDCPAGVKPLATKGGLSVFPNPVNNMLHIDAVEGAASYRLLNMVGSVVMSGVLQAGSNTVNLKDIAGGVYMLEVEDPSTRLRVTKRIVKE